MNPQDLQISALTLELRSKIAALDVATAAGQDELAAQLTSDVENLQQQIDSLQTQVDGINTRVKAIEHRPQVLNYIGGGGGGVSTPEPKQTFGYFPQGW